MTTTPAPGRTAPPQGPPTGPPPMGPMGMPPAGRPPTKRMVPATPLPEAPGTERVLRTVLVVVAVLTLVVSAGLLAIGSVFSVINRADYSQIPATQELGTPSQLSLSAPAADVAVVTDPSADQVSVSLVESGEVAATQDETAFARISRHGDRVRVEQPVMDGPFPFMHDDHRDVVLTVPSELAPSFSLHLDTAASNTEFTGGQFRDLTVDTGAGDVDLQDLTVGGDLKVNTGAGNVSVALSPEASPSSVTLQSGVGDLDLQVPEGMTFHVHSPDSGVGQVDIAPGIDSDSGPDLNIRTSTGDVDVSH